MHHSNELTLKERIIDATTRVIRTLRYPLLGLLIALALFVIVYLIVGEVRSRRIEQSTTIVEAIEDDFFAWLGSEEGEARETAAVDLIDRIESVLAKYPRYYAAQRALYLRGRMFFQTGASDLAKESFVEIADRFPKSYLAPIALVNAATSMEEAERYADAIEILVRVANDFPTPELPAVLFSLGRLSEMTEEYDEAVSYYERLLDEYPSSGWTNLARSRIIVVNIGRS